MDPSLPSSPADAADPLAAVSFARASDRAKGAVGDDGTSRFIIFAGVGTSMAMVLWFVARTVTDLTGLSNDIASVIAIAIGMLTIPATLVWLLGPSTPRSFKALPKEADAGARIHMLMPRERLDPAIPVDGADFEPEYFRLLLVTPRGGIDTWIYAAFVLGAFPLHWVLRSAMSFNLPLIFAFYFSAFVAAFVVGMVRQTYIRVAPGRLDVLQFTAWRPEADVCRTYNLRDGPVVIDPRRRGVVTEGRPVEHWGPGRDAQRIRAQRAFDRMVAKAWKGDQKPVVLNYIACPTPGRLAHTLLRAAVSTAPIPDLPRDRLHD